MRSGSYSRGRESPSAAESREMSTSRICTPDSAKSAADRLLPRRLAISTLSCSSSSIWRRMSFIWLLMSRTEDCSGGRRAGARGRAGRSRARVWVGRRQAQAGHKARPIGTFAAAQAETQHGSSLFLSRATPGSAGSPSVRPGPGCRAAYRRCCWRWRRYGHCAASSRCCAAGRLR